MAINDIAGFLQSCEAFLKKTEEINKEIPSIGDDFNIFTAISDQYKKENLHSDILKQILESRINKDENHRFLGLFLDTLEIENPFTDTEMKGIQIDREVDKLDLFIYSGDKGIIVENKINGAADQDRQIERYYNAKTQESDFSMIQDFIMMITKF